MKQLHELYQRLTPVRVVQRWVIAGRLINEIDWSLEVDMNIEETLDIIAIEIDASAKEPYETA